MAKMIVSDLMTAEPKCVRTEDSALEAYDMMTEKHFRHLPVVDADNNLVGLVTDRDLLRHALAQLGDLPLSEQRRYLETIRISEVMTQDPEVAQPSDDLEAAGQTLLDQKFGCLPVCDGEQLVGILTEADFVKYFVAGSNR